MKIQRLEAHDRLQFLKKDQSYNIFQGAEDCLKKNSLSIALQEKSSYIYIFAHPRTAEDGVTKIMYWQPRLSKPKPQSNSYLFRAKSKSDQINICWLLPPREQWDEYITGKVTEDNLTNWSINQFRFNLTELERSDPEDMSEDRAKKILSEVLIEHNQSLKPKQVLSVDSSF